MLKNILIIVVLLIAANISFASPVSEKSNLDVMQNNVTEFNKILQIEDGFAVSSTRWSPDGQRLLVTCSKSISRSNSIHKHYLLDVDSHTFGEINYGIKEFSSYSIPGAKWAPSGDRIYFRVSRNAGPSDYGNCFVVCNPDGTNLRGIGTNYTDLSSIINNLGSIGSQNNLKWSPDSTKIVFDWEKPGNIFTGVYLANGNGIDVHEIRPEASQPAWYDSNKIFFVTYEGTVVLSNNSSDLTQTFKPENKDERYTRFSLSPDNEKIIFTSTTGNGLFQTYISNTDGSNLKKHISDIDGSLLNEFVVDTWQPNGSLLLVNQNESLYIVEGEENEKHLLYEGNASEAQWFSSGKKILFVKNKNKLYSINVDGTDLTFITNFGLATSYLWSSFEEAKQFSISPSDNIIAFTSALYPDTGKITESEPDPSTRQNIAAPLFIINSDGSNLTQVTSTMKGRYDTFGEWSHSGEYFTIDSVTFPKDSESSYGGSSLVELGARNYSSIWKSLPVKKILGSEEPITISKNQNDESNYTDRPQVTENKKTNKQSPSFLFLQLFTCIMGIWLMRKREH
jgi:Tol biopolymer transport system component